METPPENPASVGASEAREPGEDGPPSGSRRIASALPRLVWAVVFTGVVFFFLHFLASNPALWARPRFGGVFRSLSLPWIFGDAMDWGMLAWSAGALAVIWVVGWFVVECFEVYLPRTASVALALPFGLGLIGFLLELVAMAGFLTRWGAVGVCAAALAVLWPLSHRAANRRPEHWGAGEGGYAEQAMRRRMAREHFASTVVAPPAGRAFAIAAFALVAAILAAVAWHALLYPETYWDSLILYLGYARAMFHERGIVTKVVGQVGVGLGANYPHLFSLLGAGICASAGEWSELPQRLIAPVAGLASTALVFHTALRATRDLGFSAAVALLYRSIPLGIVYDQYASDYALSILFAAAFLHLAQLYIETGLRGYLALATLLVGFSMHLNYLMGILWLPWGATILLAHSGSLRAGRTGLPPGGEEDEDPVPEPGSPEPPPAWTFARSRPSPLELVRSRSFLASLALCGAVASTWHVRNWIVTGNPVYAFFHEIFGGIHINPDVMRSAEKEWALNGAGIARFGDTLSERIAGAWDYFVTWRQAYRLQPFLAAFAVPGGILLLARALARLRRGVDPATRFGLVALLLAVALMAFHFVLAPFYLYQIVMILPALAVLVCFLQPFGGSPERPRGRRFAFGAACLAIGLVPGLAMALMGFKVMRPVPTGIVRDAAGIPRARVETQIDLFALRRPMPDARTIYRWHFGDDAAMFEYVNDRAAGERILTHDNRHLCYDPSIELVHLDDWGMQALWPFPPAEKVARLKKLGIRRYLYVPNEDRHEINAKMGAKDWAALGLAEEEFRAGANVLYRLK